MLKKLYTGLILLALLTMSACQGTLFQNVVKEQTWSENYALADGVQCTSPEMIDGDKETTGVAMFPETIQGKTVYGAFPNAEVDITLPEKKNISKIVIYSDDLSDFRVLASTGARDEWKLIKEFTSNKQKEIVIRTSILTDKIKIRARGKSPVNSTETVRVLGGVLTSRKIAEPEIKEIELYGFK